VGCSLNIVRLLSMTTINLRKYRKSLGRRVQNLELATYCILALPLVIVRWLLITASGPRGHMGWWCWVLDRWVTCWWPLRVARLPIVIVVREHYWWNLRCTSSTPSQNRGETDFITRAGLPSKPEQMPLMQDLSSCYPPFDLLTGPVLSGFLIQQHLVGRRWLVSFWTSSNRGKEGIIINI
jgi:hypothetical protein